jgi:hypothetical protein
MKPKKHANTQECLEDYLREKQNATELASFVKVQLDTVYRWAGSTKIMPTGGNLLRLQYFLIYSGYRLTEFDSLSKDLIDLGHCFVLNIVSLPELVQRKLIDRTERFFTYFQATRTFSPEKMEIVRQINLEHCEQLNNRLHLINYQVSSTESGETDELLKSIEELSDSCKSVRRLANLFLKGSKGNRIEMRNRLGTGEKPVLHEAWTALKQLLKEDTVYEK